jgi:signal transduction histidine kinase
LRCGERVLWNLLSNAIKFTPEGGTIAVRLRQNGSSVELSVSDTGVGIRSDFLPHIFDRFQQADRSITRRFGGLGIGLSIVKHLVELHGGTIRADSGG